MTRLIVRPFVGPKRTFIAAALVASTNFLCGAASVRPTPPLDVGIATVSPELVAPGQYATASGVNVEFWWRSHDPYAADFYLEIATDAGFANLVFSDWVGVQWGGNLWFQLIRGFPDAGFGYYWHVYAYNSSGFSPPSPTWWFKNGPSAPPSMPGLTSPANATNVSGTTIPFRWTLGERASNFRLTVSNHANLSDPVFDQWIGPYLGVDLGNFPDNGASFYWRVTAGNDRGSVASSTYFFTNGPSSAPENVTLVSPPDRATVNGEMVTLWWNPARRAANYDVQVALDPSFTSLVLDQRIGDFAGVEVSGFADDGTSYYWRVRACNSRGCSSFSSVWLFVNGPSSVPDAPSLLSPAYGENIGGPEIRFLWNEAARATDYFFELAADSAFAHIIFGEWVGNYFGIDLAGFPDDGGMYWWRVTAGNARGEGPPSSAFVVVNGPSAVPDAPVLVQPSHGARVDGTEVLFEWQPTPRAADFFLQIALDSGFGQVVFGDYVHGPYLGLYVGGFPDNGVVLWWRVLATNDLGDGPWSAAYQFQNGPSGSPEAPVLLQPRNSSNAGGEVVSFAWDNAARAVDYRLDVSYTSTFTEGVVFSAWLGNVNGGDLGPFLDNGDRFYWRVRARNEAGEGPSSPVWSFVNGPSLPPEVPRLLSPGYGAVVSGSSVVFQWAPARRATTYVLSVRSNLGLVFEDVVDLLTAYVVQRRQMPGEQFAWHVEAYNSKGSTASEEWPFRFNDCNQPLVGSGVGIFGPQPEIDTCYDSGSGLYMLSNISKRQMYGGGMRNDAAIETQLFQAGVVESNDNHAWGVTGAQRAAVDAHVYVERAYEYAFGLHYPSYDWEGRSMVTMVESSTCVDGAFWNGTLVTICEGGARPSYACAQDAVAHEWGHAYTHLGAIGREVDLEYAGESGALSEAFSDWFGTAVEFSAFEENWTIGEMPGYDGIRDMANPLRFGHADTYRRPPWVPTEGCAPAPSNDYCGVHSNSGVANKMFYLLVEGGRHNGVIVQGIGVDRAMAIGFVANMTLWGPKATFADAAVTMLLVANEYGPAETQSVRDAWRAVGVAVP